ncbi:hypothetical protein HYR99_16210 [Candidatus Poribacteria bacterium]|nr:hypothetical protein [Candidatus Poribacteria bacterium]
MTRVLTDNRCIICGIPLDAEYFDVSGFVGKALRWGVVDPFVDLDPAPPEPLPERGEQRVLASFQLHPQYCGVLTHFAQYTDLYAWDNSQIRTPGFEWIILQNGKPLFPYTRLEMIINPWGYNCLPVSIRLDENARVELVIRNRSISDLSTYPIKAFAGRIMGRYWYNESFGGRVR